MISEMTNIAAECVKKPRTTSVWSSRLNKYVCIDTDDGRDALVEQGVETRLAHPPISSTFKLVFVTAFFGTLLFAATCVVLSLAAGREPPPLFEKVVLALFDLVKIGFGAIVGLLGGVQFRGSGLR
jgi:hypothetical protein